MAGIIAIYGLVVAVLIAGTLGRAPKYDLYKYVFFVWQNRNYILSNILQYNYNYIMLWQKNGLNSQEKWLSVINKVVFLLLVSGFTHLGAGLAVGFSGLAAGFAIGIVGDAGVRGTAQQPRLFVGMILILIFAEVLGLYGLIVAIYLYTK